MATRVRAAEDNSLPDPLIHYIQSFMTGKEAAQTSFLSKSWCRAWMTRPNIDFDQSDFYQLIFGDPEKNPFALYTKRTLQRYADLNLQIDTFKLRINGWERAGYALADHLLVKAIEIGATDVNFQLCPSTVSCGFPAAVLGSETLTRLTVAGCKIEDVKVRCSGLKFLSLQEVCLEDDMLLDVLSRCPLIEDLVLTECKSFSKIRSPANNKFIAGKRRMLALCPSSSFDEMENQIPKPMGNLFKLHMLKTMSLEKVKISSLFFSDFSTRFPCLKSLVIFYCYGYKEVYIKSKSLEYISFAQKSILRASFDVSSLIKFSFEGSNVLPWFAFDTGSSEWESDITVCCRSPSITWFYNLYRMLTNLSSSTIYLALDLLCGEKSFNFTGELVALPVVENLTLHASYIVSESVLDGIFWSCRPQVIIQNWLPGMREQPNEYLLRLLLKMLAQDGRQNRPHLYDLKQVYLAENQILKRPPLPIYARTVCLKFFWGRRSSLSI